jgi:hypothetical protein
MRPNGFAQVAAAIVAFAVVIGIGWCFENVGTIDLMTGNRSCGKAPRAIGDWSLTNRERRPEDRAGLVAWAAKNRDSVHTRYTAFCHTPLHIAARFGREDLAPVLLAAGADVNARDKHDDRPLHLAAEYGNADVVRVLLQRGADVNARGRMDRTPLHAAAEGLAGTQDVERRLQVARLLIARGANVNAKTRGGGFTPEWYAEGSRSRAIVDLLRASGSRGTDDVR